MANQVLTFYSSPFNYPAVNNNLTSISVTDENYLEYLFSNAESAKQFAQNILSWGSKDAFPCPFQVKEQEHRPFLKGEGVFEARPNDVYYKVSVAFPRFDQFLDNVKIPYVFSQIIGRLGSNIQSARLPQPRTDLPPSLSRAETTTPPPGLNPSVFSGRSVST